MITKMLTEEQLLEKLTNVILDGRKHQDYERTIEVANWAYEMFSGDDQDHILISYKRREDAEQQEQRIAVTNTRSQYVINKIFNLYSEVHRADRTTKDIKSEADLSGLMENLSNFEGKPIENWLDDTYKYLNFLDPNAFVVMEFDNSDPLSRKPFVYPFVVSSAMAVDYEYRLGELQYLIVHQIVEVPDAEGEMIDSHHYTLYAPNFDVVMHVMPEDANYPPDEGFDVIQLGDETVYTRRFNSLMDKVPAMRIGYQMDPATDFRTYVPPFYAAEKLLTDLIWKKSEYDLAHALHGFYQKFIYVDDCDECAGMGSFYDDEREAEMQCRVCGGTGTRSHTGTADIIEVTRPKSPEDHIPLSEWVHYEQIPMELIRQQKEDVKDLEKDVFNAVFGSNVLERSEVAVTATEKNFDWRAVDNSLRPYAMGYVDLYKFMVQMTADIRQEPEITIEYAFPSSFNLESLQDKLTRRQTAVQAGSPFEIVWAMDLQVMRQLYKDDPGYVEMYKAREIHRPFKDLDIQEKQLKLSMLDRLDPIRVLYIYFDDIMDEVMRINPNFVAMDYDRAKEAVAAVVEMKRAELEASTPIFIPEQVSDDEAEPI